MGGLNMSGSRNESQSSQDVWGGQAPFLEDLFGRGQGLVDQFNPNSQIPGAAMGAWQQQLNPQANPHLGAMAGAFGDQLGQLNQQSGGQAALGGGYGGGRHGVAESINTQNVGQQMGQFYGSQYQGDMNRQAGAIAQAPGMLGMSPEQQRMQYLQQYGGLLGGPHNTGQSTSSGVSKGGGVNVS